MSRFRKLLLMSVLFCLVLTCLFIGSMAGAIAFIVMGCLLEVALWIGLFRKPKRTAR